MRIDGNSYSPPALYRYARLHRRPPPQYPQGKSLFLTRLDHPNIAPLLDGGVTEEGQVRLLDFGIAKLLDAAAEAEIPRTKTGLHVMTPEYASPEQIRGEAITTATDVHGLGVLLYELLTEHRPYTAPHAATGELERKILEEDPVASSKLGAAKELRGDLDAIVLKALRKDPLRRFGSAAEMAAASSVIWRAGLCGPDQPPWATGWESSSGAIAWPRPWRF